MSFSNVGVFALFVCAAALAGCDTTTSDTEAGASLAQPLTADAVVLDDGIWGIADAAPDRGDGFRSVTITEVPEGFDLLGARVFDARSVDGGVVTVGVDHTLRLYTGEGVRVLDTDVIPPISIAAQKIAYARGFPPDIRLTVYQLDADQAVALLPELMPVWSPALSADGREVVFAASPNGRPELLRVAADGQVREVASAGRTPSSPFAPVWNGRHLVFEDEHGRARLDLETGELEVLGGDR
jgi:hypothetical protein